MHPVSQEYRRLLRNWREGIKEQWALGNFTAKSIEESVILNSEAVGQINNLDKLIELEYEEFSEGLGYEERIGLETFGSRGFDSAV